MDTEIDLPLRPIQLPDPISLWPPAYGWWLVFLCLVLVIFFGWLIKWYFKRSSVKRVTLLALKRLEQEIAANRPPDECIRDISELLRRYVITKNPKLAGLVGEEWIKALAHLSPKFVLQENAFTLISAAPYKKGNSVEEARRFLNLVSVWIKQS